MAKIVDHEKKRRAIVKVTARIISKEGMSAVTTRHIAKMARSSLGILTHYFVNKDEIVSGALHWCDERFMSRLESMYDADNLDLDDFIPLFKTLLPLDEMSDMEWRVRANLLTHSLTHPKLVQVRKDKISHAYKKAKKFVRKLQESGEIRSDIDAVVLSKMIVDLAFGLCINLLSFSMAERRAKVDKKIELMLSILRPEY
ncbi:MAG: TetR/AcrR family transcriptional regulator [Cellvibrionales bacterium]|nr:TetR/AcrR family transcriptional regulator [Cellvibrionales bacterium]